MTTSIQIANPKIFGFMAFSVSMLISYKDFIYTQKKAIKNLYFVLTFITNSKCQKNNYKIIDNKNVILSGFFFFLNEAISYP